ncbi:hypothetical protein ACIG87_10830 [Micromonospora sp. NPDC051925]|uniref:hypothetical protein n=1 Tax=Micromonospora sp. NPDC051925 TaxID=3364288 RepID=UPI0037C87895
MVATTLFAVPGTAQAAPKDPEQGAAACPTEHVYSSVSNQGQVHYRVGPGYQNYNGTNSTATVKLTATVAGTVSYSLSSTANVKVDVIVAGVEGSLGVNVTTSLTASVVNEISVSARPKTYVYGDYGVWRQKSKGLYEIMQQSCNVNSSWITSYMPARVGWNVWGG